LNSTKSIIDSQISDLRSLKLSDKDVEVISDDQKQQIQEQILNPSSVNLPVLRDFEQPAPQSRDMARYFGQSGVGAGAGMRAPTTE